MSVEVEVEKGVFVELTEEIKDLLRDFRAFCRRLGGTIREIRLNWISCILPKPMDIDAYVYTGRERKKVYGWLGFPSENQILTLDEYDLGAVILNARRTARDLWGELDETEDKHTIKLLAKNVKEIELTVSGKMARFDFNTEIY